MNLAAASIYTDFQGLAELKFAADDSPEAIKAVAKQFEALFLQMMLKSMREASIGEGLMDNDQTRLFQGMFDQQIALDMAEKGQAGIGDLLQRQLQGVTGAAPNEASPRELDMSRLRFYGATTLQAQSEMAPSASATLLSQPPVKFDSPAAFVAELWPLARRSAQALGVAPEVLISQAALETGWGRGVIGDAAGVSSHNLFNIKADQRWSGEQMTKSTLEYEKNYAQHRVERFRAYPSFAASFDDYVNFLRSSPRYTQALEQGGDSGAYISELHRAGYATDPEYPMKINKILNGVVIRDAVERLKEVAI